MKAVLQPTDKRKERRTKLRVSGIHFESAKPAKILWWENKGN